MKPIWKLNRALRQPFARALDFFRRPSSIQSGSGATPKSKASSSKRSSLKHEEATPVQLEGSDSEQAHSTLSDLGPTSCPMVRSHNVFARFPPPTLPPIRLQSGFFESIITESEEAEQNSVSQHDGSGSNPLWRSPRSYHLWTPLQNSDTSSPPVLQLGFSYSPSVGTNDHDSHIFENKTEANVRVEAEVDRLDDSECEYLTGWIRQNVLADENATEQYSIDTWERRNQSSVQLNSVVYSSSRISFISQDCPPPSLPPSIPLPPLPSIPFPRYPRSQFDNERLPTLASSRLQYPRSVSRLSSLRARPSAMSLYSYDLAHLPAPGSRQEEPYRVSAFHLAMPTGYLRTRKYAGYGDPYVDAFVKKTPTKVRGGAEGKGRVAFGRRDSWPWAKAAARREAEALRRLLEKGKDKEKTE